jgi:hypothetical protein
MVSVTGSSTSLSKITCAFEPQKIVAHDVSITEQINAKTINESLFIILVVFLCVILNKVIIISIKNICQTIFLYSCIGYLVAEI